MSARKEGALVAEPRSVENGGWYVFWYDPATRTYGARGWGLDEAAARALADRINTGQEAP